MVSSWANRRSDRTRRLYRALEQTNMEQKLGAAIVGTGWVSGEHIQAYQRIRTRTSARSSAATRPGPKPKRGSLAHDCRAYSDLDEMLRDDSVQIVSICTPHHLHAEQGDRLCPGHRHVLVEKPVALDLESLHALDSAVRSAGVRSLVSFVLRWNPLFDIIKAQLASGLIGNIYLAEVDYLHTIGPEYTGYHWIMQRQLRRNGTARRRDVMPWMRCAGSSAEQAVEVFAFANYSRTNPMKFGYEPNSVTFVRFADGTMGKVSTSFEAVGPYTFNIALFGDQGTIRNNQVFTNRWPGQKGLGHHADHTAGYRRGRRTTRSPAEDGSLRGLHPNRAGIALQHRRCRKDP